MIDAPNICINTNDRVLALGRTGSGKTTFIKALLNSRMVERYVVLDPKNRYTPPRGVPIGRRWDPSKPRQVVRVPFGAEVIPEYAALMAQVFRKQTPRSPSIVVMVDEVALITPLRPATIEYAALIRTGREPRIGVWSATQRPADIPPICYTESEHILVFQLTDRRDRKRVVEFTGDKMAGMIDSVKGHEFIYYNVLEDTCAKMVLKL